MIGNVRMRRAFDQVTNLVPGRTGTVFVTSYRELQSATEAAIAGLREA